MSLRATILAHSLPLLPTHSFTRATLVHALTSLPPSHPDRRETPVAESAVDTIFGPGNVGATRALVEAWEEAGTRDMLNPPSASSSASLVDQEQEGGVGEMLQRRLEWSAAVGEYLVEAYANLSTPTTPPSIPLPSLPTSLVSRFLTSFQLPPLYSPPSSPSSSDSSPSPSSSHSTDSVSSSAFTSSLPPGTSSSSSSSSPLLSLLATSRLPLITINPLGPLSYAFRIADTAMTATERAVASQQRTLRRGAWSEPLGAGSEWYLSRGGLALVYLVAESHLLQPIPNDPLASSQATPGTQGTQGTNLHLSAALKSLDTNLHRYKDIMAAMESGEHGFGEALGYLGFVGRSLQGVIRSRGL